MKLGPQLALTVGMMAVLVNPCGMSSSAFAADAQPAAAAEKPAAGTDKSGAAGKSTAATPSTATASKTTPAAADNLNDRLAVLENAVNNASEVGQLTNEQADNFRSILGRMAEEEAQFVAVSGSNLDQYENQRLQLALDRLEKSFYLALHDRKVAVLDLPTKLNNVSSRLQRAVDEGRLSRDKADELQHEMDAIKALAAGSLSKGHVSYGNALIVSMRLDRFIHDFGIALNDRPVQVPDLEHAQSAAKEAIAACAEKAGERQKDLQSEFTQLSDARVKLKDIKDDWQHKQESLRIAAQFDLLADKAKQLSSGVDVSTRNKDFEQKLDQDISDALSGGRLRPNEAQQLLSELKAIQAENATQSGSRVALELARLSGRIDRTQHAPAPDWSGLVTYQVALDQRISDGQKAGRITADEQAQFKASADQINKKLTEARASDNRLDAGEALETAMQLERLEVQLHHALKDRGVSVPDIQALQAQLDRTVVNGVESGRLEEGEDLSKKLAHVTELQQGYAAKLSGSVDDRAKLAIALETERAIADIEGLIHRSAENPVSIDARLGRLNDMVSNAVAWGWLSVDRGAQYKAAVDTVFNELWNARNSKTGLTANQSLAIANDAGALEEQLQDELREAAVLPPELKPRYREVVKAIGNALANGRISVADADGLAGDLLSISMRHQQALATDGGISHGEGLKLGFELERVAAKLESELRDEPLPIADVGQQMIQVDRKLANGLASGRLTTEQSEKFKQGLADILMTSAQYRSTGNSMSYPETIALSLQINKLQNAIDGAVVASKGGNDVDTRQAQLSKSVKGALAAGKITPKAADELNDALDRIALSEAAFRTSDEGLSYAEALALTQDLDRVSSRFDSLSRGQLTLKNGKH